MGDCVRLAVLLALTTSVFWSTSHAATYVVTVAGLGGEKEFDDRFSGWAKDVEKMYQGSDVKAETFYGPKATREKLLASLTAIAGQAQAADSVIVMLIGHGTFDGSEYKFNLPGPDISGAQLAAALDKIPAQKQVVVIMTSTSGGSIAALRRENRVVVTATRNGTERNATIFGRYFVEAIRDAAADTDKNDSVTVLEAFRYADSKTTKFFETQKRLATEHALLEDTGKGEGVRAPSAENGQGLLAGRIALVRLGSGAVAARTPEKQKLLARKDELENEIDKLKYQKAATPSDEYRQKLGVLLLELAKTQAELDK